MADRPDTLDIWEFVEWALENGGALYARIPMLDRNTGQMVPTLSPLGYLEPREWIYWVRRYYHDASTPIRTLSGWRARGVVGPRADEAFALPSTEQTTNTNLPETHGLDTPSSPSSADAAIADGTAHTAADQAE